MMDTIARTGSFAAAARELGKVPSALTYSVRQLEDALDVLLFDRSSRQARSPRPAPSCSTKAGACWPRWTPSPTASSASRPAGRRSSPSPPTPSSRAATLLELCEAFYACRGGRRGRRRARSWQRTRAAGHAAAPAHRGDGRHLGGAGHGPGRPGHRRRLDARAAERHDDEGPRPAAFRLRRRAASSAGRDGRAARRRRADPPSRRRRRRFGAAA